MKHRFVAVVAVPLFLAALAPGVRAKPKQAVPRETVTIASSCADVWQPLLELIDGEYPITFIYDPWHRVTFLKASTANKVAQALLGGSLPGATVQLRSDPTTPAGANFCLAEIYSDESLGPEVAKKFVAALPGAAIVPHKPQGGGK
jgi:hypothetical protein